MNQKKKYLHKLPEIVVLLFCMVLLGVGVSRKEGFHMDELLSFELSNAEFNPWIVPTQPEGRLAKFVRNEIDGETFGETLENLADTVTDVLRSRGSSKLLSYKADVYEEPVWITRQQFVDYLTVDEKDDFQYLSVYFNVKDDNHPPVHFMLLHTMSSLFRDLPFAFLGCFINMASVAAAMVFLMKIGRILAVLCRMEEQGRLLGLLAALLYGCSAGAMASVLLIRMYCVMTAFCVALFYYHLRKWQDHSFDNKNKGMIAVTVLGFLTQYFFLFYCMILALVTAVILLCSKRGKELLIYIRSMVIAGIIGLAVFPFAISDVFSSGRGVEALENLSEGFTGYGERLGAFAGILCERTFGYPVMIVLSAAVLGLAAVNVIKYVSTTKRAQAAGNSGECTVALILLCIPVLGYFLLAARMSPYLVDRYIMPLFPFVMLIGAVVAVKAATLLLQIRPHNPGKSYKNYIGAGICAVLLIIQLGHLWNYDGSYLYQGYRKQHAVAGEYESYPCICVYDGVGYYENLLEFTCFEKTLLVKEAELADRKETASVSGLDQVVVLIKQNADRQKVCDILQEKYGLEYREDLYSDSVYGDELLLFGSKKK